MMKRFFSLIACALLAICSLNAQEVPASAWGNLPPLHVEGRHLVDPYGNNVVLHGVMDTPSPYFNNYRWGNSCSTSTDAKKAVAYFDKLFTAITDTAHGAYCNVFRLHLDCCWTNDNSVNAPGFTTKNGKTYDPHGNEVGGEADIRHFSATKLKNFLKMTYFPIAKKAIEHGLYVIMRPPGVFPGYVQVGDYYNDYIMKVWDIVTQNDSIKKYSGQISIELGNEPVTLKNAQGQNDDKALCDFFQPVVDKMRENGYEGVIWGVGTGWQGNTEAYGKYPLVGKNIGYAVHNYVGWYGANDNTFSVWGAGPYAVNSAQGMAAYANEFHKSHPIMDTNPIVITEVDWSPEKEGTGHYNEHGDWVLSNYGTWATGSTSKWGAAYKYMMDKYDNVSMTLSGTACFIDIDDYQKNGRVTPAFKTAMEKNGLDPWEGSGVACFEWYKQWAKVNYARPDLSKPSSDPDLAITALEADAAEVTMMVGNTPAFRLKGTFAGGMESYIPADICNLKPEDESLFGEKDGAMIALAEGTTNVSVTYTSPAGNSLSKDLSVKVVPPFANNKYIFDSSIRSGATATVASSRVQLQANAGNVAGWTFDAGIDLSDKKYIVATLAKQYSALEPALRIYDSSDAYGDDYYEVPFGTEKVVKAQLEGATKVNGKPLDVSNIKIVGLYTGKTGSLILMSVFASNDGETNAIQSVEDADKVLSEEYFSTSGQRLSAPERGVNIIRQKLVNGGYKTVKKFVK